MPLLVLHLYRTATCTIRRIDAYDNLKKEFDEMKREFAMPENAGTRSEITIDRAEYDAMLEKVTKYDFVATITLE